MHEWICYDTLGRKGLLDHKLSQNSRFNNIESESTYLETSRYIFFIF